MAGTINLVCTRERLGETVTELKATPVPEGQVVGETFVPAEGCEVASGWEVFSYQFSTLGSELWTETLNVFFSAISALPSLALYVGLILACMFAWRAVKTFFTTVLPAFAGAIYGRIQLHLHGRRRSRKPRSS